MKSSSLHARVVDAVGARIVAGDLAPGETFTVRELEEEFGISRSVAREVVRVMESLGLVASRTRVGCTVQEAWLWNALSPQVIRWQMRGPWRALSLGSLVELRAGVEPVAARLAARRASWNQVQVMVDAAARMTDLGHEDRGTDPGFLEADITFHEALLLATGNPAYAALVPTVIACLRERSEAGLTPARPAEVNLTNHSELALAIGRRDEDAAERLARAIVTVVSDETHH
ncbi:MAG TPA: FadR family transcriptional regulator [Propionibacterium sp.]|nr:FadR family transcriptional regulator [Propionibacterium sp.]